MEGTGTIMATSLKSLRANSITPVIVTAGVSSGVKITGITFPSGASAGSNAGGETVTVTGSGFNSGAKVYVDTTLCTTTYGNNTSLSFTTPAKSIASYHLYVYNTDGSAGVLPGGLEYSALPIWVTSSGALPAGGTDAAYSQTVSATGDGTITYSITSGSLPTGLSLNSSTGAITGTLPGTAASNSFTITATDSQNQTSTRSFSIDTLSTAFTISPSVDGKSSWNFVQDGALSISTYGTYTLTPVSTFSANVKMWGGGGGSGGQNGSSGAGGSSTGIVTFTNGVSHVIVVGQGGPVGAGAAALGGGGVGDVNRGNGGGYTGIFRNSQTQGNAVLMAGGGGGAGGGFGSFVSGAGGGTSGQAGNAGQGAQPGGGTQSAGGAGTGANHSASGGALQGANGLSGGGGGYYGGASGGDNGSYAPGTGGGSGYINGTYVTGGNTYTGNGGTPGNSSDSDRGTAGNARTSSGAGTDGKIIINL
jgi:hypothetical protein